MIGNGFDFLLETIFPGIRELQEFTELLEEKFTISKKNVHYVVDDIKREGFMTNPLLI